MKHRFLTTLLSAGMALSMLLGTGIMTQTAEAATTEFVSLPVTIRDYAADGMLFQWNELGSTGDQIAGASVAAPNVSYTSQAGGGAYSATTGNGYVRYTSTSTGIYITYSVSGSYTRNSMRYCVLKYRTSSNYSSQPTIGHRWNNGGSNNYVNLNTDGYNQSDFKSVVVDLGSGTDTVTHVTIYPRLASGAYIDIAEIAFFSEQTNANNYASGTATGGATYHHGSTKGFGLLQTDAKDHFNDLADSAAISGTALTQNGTWNSATVTTSEATLNSGAKQTLYGCYVRTDLVEPKLGANGKPVYTEATVTYLANYMQKTLPEVWRNADGTYNMWYVMGTKLFDNNNNYVGPVSSATRDLASVLRSTITGGLGSYAGTKAKPLTQVTDCTTYFDAAYFLLSNVFSDNVGYGQTVNEYHTINLVKKVGTDGKTHYVYNSAYDGTVYDTTNGVIYNGQTETITTREGTTYVRGNLQPESRFDPIYNISRDSYYGRNGDAYADAVDNTADAKYYDYTNYNLTLEGHAKFIYYADDDLYFTFTGDDDVYLYINGTRVLDLGGAHAISKCGISLNNVAALCNLKDGDVCDLDFYYMERHGTAANFGIETNIQVLDPSMLTEKNAYQDGQNVGYNGFVDPGKPVTYSFQLTNNGETPIRDLTFEDNTLSVSLSKDSIILNNSETNMTDLSLFVLNPDGSKKVHVPIGQLTEDTLKAALSTGLEVNESIVVYGFNHTVTDPEWAANNDTFPNTVYTSAVAIIDSNTTKALNGIASCQVQKGTYTFEQLHYYEWKGHGVTATTAELIQPVLDAVGEGRVTASSTIQLCSASGQIIPSGINSKAQVTNDGILYTGTVTGSDTYYYLVDGVDRYGPIAVTVYSYDVCDNVYVLDYSLPVELNDDSHGLLKNDTVTLPSNPYKTTCTVPGVTQKSETYGTFAFDPVTYSLKYTMNKFMNGTDEVHVTVQVQEDGSAGVTPKTGVIMEEKVTVVPASVVYYEDDFSDITYENKNDNQWNEHKSDDSYDNEQSADQDTPYGQDENYQKDKDTEYTKYVLDPENSEGTNSELTGDASNGTIHELTVETTGEVMNFSFQGTGFEIVSRTTQGAYAVVSVKVERVNADGSFTTVKQFPVITECKGGDLYQVPIISVTGLSRANYKVTLSAAGKKLTNGTETKTRVLYIDGIRIFEPLDDVEEAKYYNPDEVNAEFFEIKELIRLNQAIYAAIDKYLNICGGTWLIEGSEDSENVLEGFDDNFDDNLNLKGFDDFSTYESQYKDKYMRFGPNNELYMNGSNATNILAFYLSPIDGFAENARTVEIGAHRKSDSSIGDNDPIRLLYGSTAEAIVDCADDSPNKYDVSSGTEQYYEIDVNNLVWDAENNRYLLLISTPEFSYTTLSLTTLKVSGYTLENIVESTVSSVQEGTIASDPVLTQIQSIRSMRMAASQTVDAEEPEASKPEASEIEVSEPEASEPAASEPEASEPAASEPAASEPEASEPAASEPEASEPAASEPEASEPAASEPEPSEPAASEPEASEPAASEPEASEPAASEPEASEPAPEDTTPTSPTVNENLQIQSAALCVDEVVAGENVTLAVKAGEGAVKLVVYDADGNAVELITVTSELNEGVMTFQAMWNVTGNPGSKLTYTVVVYDANGLASVNTMEVTVTIK